MVRNTQYGITFFMKDGGSFEDIQFSNISIETVVPDSVRLDRGTNSYAVFMDIERRNRESELGTIRNVVFSDININTVDGNCLFAGMPKQKIENVTLYNVRMRVLRRSDLSDRHKPRGTRKLRNIAVNDYAYISSHFTFAYVKGLNIRNLFIEDETPDNQFERYAIWAKDVDDVEINGFHQTQAVDNRSLSVFKFTNGRHLNIRDCTPKSPNTNFLELTGEFTADVSLIANDFTKVKNPVRLANAVNERTIFKKANQER